MSNKTGISWTDSTLNVVTGCTKISPACDNCYAARYAQRGIGDFKSLVKSGYTANYEDDWDPRPFSEVRTHPDRLKTPLHWRKSRKIFICSMGDLFHEQVPDEFIDQVFAMMALCPQHTFQVLTKRAERMFRYFNSGPWGSIESFMKKILPVHDLPEIPIENIPLKNVWLGVTAENQKAWDERVGYLSETPAVVRFVSAEPLLSEIYTRDLRTQKIDWVIAGGETGPGARPMHPDWVRSLRDQCVAANVPFHFKSWGRYVDQSQMANASINMLDGKEWIEFPEVKQ
jgi:protein gp37